MFSKSTEYALQALLYLHQHGKKGHYLGLQHIARDGKMPYYFLNQVLRRLVRAKILRTSRGSRGGFMLRRRADRITVLEIVEAFEGEKLRDGCLMGKGKCSPDVPCPVHHGYKPVREKLLEVFGTTIDRLPA
jgi:Rrf2 family iron-sulfur cluster assembly transcriptional regulator